MMIDPKTGDPAPRERRILLAALGISSAEERSHFLDRECGGDGALRGRLEEWLREAGDRTLDTSERPRPAAATEAFAAAKGAAKGAVEAAMADPTSSPESSLHSETVPEISLPPAEPLSPEIEARLAALKPEEAGERIGVYRLLQQIGEGGFGIVWMAEQERPVRRRVALKIIKVGMDTREVIARFEQERQALAMMEHPNIAKVFDAGATPFGRPFFAMELVRGVPITEYCDLAQLPTRGRLELFVLVCQAVQHAHQKGIIHRDLKPTNVLVTLHDGVPVPKIIDFGVAKATQQRLTEMTLFTRFEHMVGTPLYMSPEQVEMSGLDIDTRSDIYALGILLYELLTGRTPIDSEEFKKLGLDDVRRVIREEEPLPPSSALKTMAQETLTSVAQQRRSEPPKLIHAIRGDLDWIVMKALEKDRTRRYATANGLATDIQRFLNNEPVSARPPSQLYRFGKFATRYRGTFVAVGIIVLTLLTGAGVSLWQAVRALRAEQRALAAQREEAALRSRAEEERKRAEHERASARLNEYVADMNLAQQSLNAGNYGRAFQLLGKHRPDPGEPDLRGFEWRYLWQVCQGNEHTPFPDADGPVQSIALSPSGELLAVGLREKLSIWNARERTPVASLPRGAVSMAFLPDGKALVAAGPGSVRVWRTSDWTETASWIDGPGPIALSRDGKRLATSSRDGIRIRDTATWNELRLIRGASAPMAFSPDGQTLAADAQAGITLWPVEEGGAPSARPGSGAGAAAGATRAAKKALVLAESGDVFVREGGPFSRVDRGIAFSPDGKFLVAPRNALSDRGVFVLSIWDARSGQEVAVMPDNPAHIEHTGVISSVAFSPDGKTLATASMDHSIRLWEFETRKRIATLQGHVNEVLTMAFSPDGRSLASGARGGGVKFWPIHSRNQEEALPDARRPLGFSPDGKSLAALARRNRLVIFNMATMEPEQEVPLEAGRSRHPASIAVSGDLKKAAQGMGDGRVKLWDVRTLQASTVKVSDRPVEIVALSPDGSLLVTGSRGESLRLRDLRTGADTPLPMRAAAEVLFSPDGRTLAVLPATDARGPRQIFPSLAAAGGPSVPAATSLPVAAVDTESVASPTPRGPPGPPALPPAFSRIRPPALAAEISHGVELWDVAAGVPGAKLESDQLTFGAAFSPDSRLVATVSLDGTARLWDVATGGLAGVCTGHKQAVRAVAFSPDGRTLATASDDSTLKLWNVATRQELLTARRLGGSMTDLLFSPDGRLLVGARGGFRSQSEGIRIYRAQTIEEIENGVASMKPAR